SQVYFSASHPDHGRELWTSDGSTRGTHLLAVLYPGEISSAPANLVAYGGSHYFAATEGFRRDPWRLDPARQPKNLTAPFARDQYNYLSDDSFVIENGEIFFYAQSGIFFTDGSADGTGFLSDGGELIGGIPDRVFYRQTISDGY